MSAHLQLGAVFMPLSGEQTSYLAMFLRYLQEGLAVQEQDYERSDDLDPFI